MRQTGPAIYCFIPSLPMPCLDLYFFDIASLDMVSLPMPSFCMLFLAICTSAFQFAVLDVQGFPILRHWYAVYPAGRQLSVVARAFLDYLLGRHDTTPTVPDKR